MVPLALALLYDSIFHFNYLVPHICENFVKFFYCHIVMSLIIL